MTNLRGTSMQRQPGLSRMGISVIVAACLVIALLIHFAATPSPTGEVMGAYSGQQDGASLQLRGTVVAKADPGKTHAEEIIFYVSLGEGAEPVNFSASGDVSANGSFSDDATALNTVVVSYIDSYQRADNLTWRADQYGPGDGDAILEPGETFRITLGADQAGHSGLLGSALNPALDAATGFSLEIRTPQGRFLNIDRTMPGMLEAVMNLH